jgi:hypothetical protein
MTLGNMRANGVRSLADSCWQCHHESVLRDPGRDVKRSLGRAGRPTPLPGIPAIGVL